METPYYQRIAESQYNKAYAAGKEVLRFSKEPVPWLKEFCQSPYFPRQARVIDFACGEGINSIYLASLGGTVTGIDIAEQAIDKARQLTLKAGLAAQYMVGDVTNCPQIPSGTFDLAVACACLGWLIEDSLRVAFLKETARTLKRGGWLFFNNGISLLEIKRSFPEVYAALQIRPGFDDWVREEQTGVFVPPSQRYETRAAYESLLEGVGYRVVHSHLDVSENAWGVVIWARKE